MHFVKKKITIQLSPISVTKNVMNVPNLDPVLRIEEIEVT